MKRNVFYLLILSLAMLSCERMGNGDSEPVQQEILTFTTVSAETRTVLSGTAVNWLATDQIKVFNNEGASAAFSTDAEHISGSSATFSGTLAASSRYYALFPYDADATISEGKITAVVPYSVKAQTAGSFDSTSNIAVATTTGSDLSFKNVLGYIKVDLTDESDVTEVVIRSMDPTKYLSGKIEITIAAEPSVTVQDGIPFVKLVPDTGDAVIAAGVYYIPVIPSTLSSGVSVRVKKSGYLYLKESANSLAVSRNTPVALPKIAVAGYEDYKELVVTSGNTGFSSCYREYGSDFSATDENLPNLGDNNKATKWLMPGTAIKAGNGGAAAYYPDGTATTRGPYLRLDFNNASRNNSPLTKAEAVIFEYDAYGDSRYDPTVLRIQEYNSGHKSADGDAYGILATLTLDGDALPAQEPYKDCYVSGKIVRNFRTDRPFFGLMLCATRTAACENLLTGFSSTYKWGMSNLRVWVHENAALAY